jgi:membrane-bound inhibitor of C-type lysozyme
VPSLVATIDLTAQGAAIAATLLYAVPASKGGLYRVTWYAKVTRAATTSSTIGFLTLNHTDNTDSVVVTGASAAVYASNASANSTQAYAHGVYTVWAKASSNINYTFSYTSSGATTMQYELHIKAEYLG